MGVNAPLETVTLYLTKTLFTKFLNCESITSQTQSLVKEKAQI